MLLRIGVGLAVSLLLTACEGGMPSFEKFRSAAGGGAGGSDAVGQTEATVTRNKIRLRGPEGFCVDPVATKPAAQEAFVVFGNCAAITGNPDQPQPYVPALVTATVTSSGTAAQAAVAPQAENLSSFFRTAEGRAVLSRSGQAGNVKISESFTEDGALFLRVTDTSAAAFEGAQPTYWRAYFDAGTSVVAMSVIGMSKTPVSSGEGLDTLQRFVERNRKPAEGTISVRVAKPDRPGLLDRLFP